MSRNANEFEGRLLDVLSKYDARYGVQLIGVNT